MNDLAWRIFIGVLCFFAGAVFYILADQFHTMKMVHEAKIKQKEAYICKIDSLERRVSELEGRAAPMKYEWKSMNSASQIERSFDQGAKHGKAD